MKEKTDNSGCLGAALLIIGIIGMLTTFNLKVVGLYFFVFSAFLAWAGFKMMVGDEKDI